MTTSRHPSRHTLACSRPLPSFRLTNYHQLTNCLKFATLLEPLSFQSVPTVKFCNSFLLITIQIAGGRYAPLPIWPSQFLLSEGSGICYRPTRLGQLAHLVRAFRPRRRC